MRPARQQRHRPEPRLAGLSGLADNIPGVFAYEALWNLALAALLIAIERRWRPRPGQLFTAYVAGYAAGRFWVEALRIDPATQLAGLRINLWTSGIVLAAALALLNIRARRAMTMDDETTPAPTGPSTR